MKAQTTTMWAMVAVVAGLVMAPAIGRAEDDAGAGRGHGARGQLRGQFKQEIRGHFQEQRQENQEFRKGLKGQEPAQAVTAIKAHVEEQYNENKTFLDAEYAKAVEAIKAKAAGKEGGDEKLQEILKKMETRRTERTQKMEARHTEIVATLNQLSQKADLTWEDIRTAMKAFHAEHQGERKGQRQGERPGRRGKGGQGQGAPAVEA